MLEDVVSSRTFSTASPESHICHMRSGWTCSHLRSDQAPSGKGPICGRWSLMALSWSLSKADSTKVAGLGRNMHKLTCWRAFWRATTGLLLFICLQGSHGSFCAGRCCKLSGHPEGSALSEVLLQCRCCWWGMWNSATKADEREPVCSQHLSHQSLKLSGLSHVHSAT